MKKFVTIGTLAALLLTIAALNACTHEEPVIDTPVEQQAEQQGYTLVINAEKVPVTKGLLTPEEGGKVIKTYWKAGEKVYAYQYDYTAGKWEELGVLTADASETVSTTLHGTLRKKPNESGFKLYLHVPYADYSMQYGLLNESTPYSIEDNFDYAISNVIKYKVDEASKTITAETDGFRCQQAIVKFNLLDDQGRPIENLGKLEIEDQAEGNNKCMWTKFGPTDGTSNHEVPVFDGKVTVDCYRNSSIYVALSNVRNSSKLHLTASTAKTDSEPYIYSYTYDKTGIVFENGCYYEITVKMKKDPINLGQIDAPFTAVDGDVLTGTLGMHKITIADNATVTLRDADLSHSDYPGWSEEERCKYAGLTLEGSANIMLEGTNKVSGFHKNYPGIYIPAGQELSIDGEGSLEARSGGRAAGIGGTYGEDVETAEDNESGDLQIKGGTITAYGGEGAAGIGSSEMNKSGHLYVYGGTINAYGGKGAAGIGSGYKGKCGNLYFWKGTITAIGGTNAAGIGSGQSGVCGLIYVDVASSHSAQSGGENIPDIGAGLDGECGWIDGGGL